MDLKLRGKVALVTASTAGLGLAAARGLLAEGARVFICGRDYERLDATLLELEQEFGADNVAGEKADVSKGLDVARLVAFCAKRFGRIDILITNTGNPTKGTFDTLENTDWEQNIQQTLMSVVRLVNAALPHLRKSDAASVLTIASVSAKQPMLGLHLSNVLRPAVVGLMKSLSQELGPEGIRVNAILPSGIQTDLVMQGLANAAARNETTVEIETKRVAEGRSLGRMGLVEEFGRSATFLVSPAASYITGTTLVIDGGFYKGTL